MKAFHVRLLKFIKVLDLKCNGKNYIKFQAAHNLNVKESDIEEALINLIDCGYLKKRRTNIVLTKTGENHLKKYEQLKRKSLLAKFNMFVKENLESIIDLVGLMISIIALLKK